MYAVCACTLLRVAVIQMQMGYVLELFSGLKIYTAIEGIIMCIHGSCSYRQGYLDHALVGMGASPLCVYM